MTKYDHQQIEKKWQDFWAKNKTFAAEDFSKKENFYTLVEFPYPSGAGLHVGHVRSYAALDAVSRKKRHDGKNVLYPIGWDAFGLPTENFAIKNKIHPTVATEKNVANFKRQLQSIGLSYDWDREINTTDPNYYKWTQWIFLKFLEKGLAYKKSMPINWCTSCKIGLANEEVVNGACERCGGEVVKKEKNQWMLAITKYADRLISDLDSVDFLPKIKAQQKNWIGKSHGAEIEFQFENFDEKVTVFTTRPDTLFGATYFVLAPEHPIVQKICSKNQRAEIEKYQKKCAGESDLSRQESKEKTGIFTGAHVINPANGKKIPVWIADYVMMGYGTGAIMCVPAHDERDFEFATKFELPIVPVVAPEKSVWTVIEKSLSPEKVLELGKFGTVKIQQTTPDWGNFFEVSVPLKNEKEFREFLKKNLLPDVKSGATSFYADSMRTGNCIVFNGKEFQLWTTADCEKFKKYGESLGIPAKQLDLKSSACGGFGILQNSYFLDGLTVPEAQKKMIEFLEEKKIGKAQTNFKLRDWVFSRQRYWGEPIPVVHCEKCGAVPLPESELPLKLPDVKSYEPTDDGQSPLARISEWVNCKCPTCGEAAKRETDTMPNWAGSSWYFLRYIDPKNSEKFADPEKLKNWTPIDLYNGGMEHTTLHLLYSRFWHKFLFDQKLVPTPEPYKKRISHGMILAEDGRKMSKSFGNVISPDEIIQKFGADTLRMYELFLGPFDQAISWDSSAVAGVRKFLDKVLRTFSEKKLTDDCPTAPFRKILARTIKKVGDDLEHFKFNTAVSQLMILFNELQNFSALSRPAVEKICVLISPFAPHLAEEIWHEILEKKDSIAYESWPKFDPKFLEDDEVTYAVQVNGKVRADFQIAKNVEKNEVLDAAKKLEKISKYLDGKELVKEIFVPGKIVGFVVK
ncbi:leucine--tRNA ligase [bacterium]|jgi:leucyl-tRNA synthetase|nr:leucine--tRNA ligase [bacterium]MBT6996480.1 leucine--tRNA ligase [bacterium]MBT7772502.1 leucine--tRNA ligase [bacterium]